MNKRKLVKRWIAKYEKGSLITFILGWAIIIQVFLNAEKLRKVYEL